MGGAGVAIFGKLGLDAVDPTHATFLRSLVMTGTLAIVYFARRTPHDPVGGRAWLFILLAGLSGAGSWLAYFAGLRIAPAAQLAALDRCSLIFVFLFGLVIIGSAMGGGVGSILVSLERSSS